MGSAIDSLEQLKEYLSAEFDQAKTQLVEQQRIWNSTQLEGGALLTAAKPLYFVQGRVVALNEVLQAIEGNAEDSW